MTNESKYFICSIVVYLFLSIRYAALTMKNSKYYKQLIDLQSDKYLNYLSVISQLVKPIIRNFKKVIYKCDKFKLFVG